MENTMDKISEFLSEKGIEFKASGSTVYSYYAPFEETARLKGSNVQITIPNGKIRICAEFPLRIRRKECAIIGREIAELNSALPEFCGYTLDPISGSIQLIGQYDMSINYKRNAAYRKLLAKLENEWLVPGKKITDSTL